MPNNKRDQNLILNEIDVIFYVDVMYFLYMFLLFFILFCNQYVLYFGNNHLLLSNKNKGKGNNNE